MPYDPDGDPDDFDPTNLDDIDAYLSDPVAHALAGDIGREFRALPPEEQIPELTTAMLETMLRRTEVAELLSDADPDDPLYPLLQALDDSVAVYGARIAELGGTPPEYP